MRTRERHLDRKELQIDRSLPIPALALARRRMLEVNRVLQNKPSPASAPKWRRLQAALQKQIAGLEKASK